MIDLNIPFVDFIVTDIHGHSKIIFLSITYFTIATELRLIDIDKNKNL